MLSSTPYVPKDVASNITIKLSVKSKYAVTYKVLHVMCTQWRSYGRNYGRAKPKKLTQFFVLSHSISVNCHHWVDISSSVLHKLNTFIYSNIALLLTKEAIPKYIT
jgi:hypothetical protein